MTVAELRAALAALPAGWTVVISQDGYGRAVVPLLEVVRSTYPRDDKASLNAAVLWPVR